MHPPFNEWHHIAFTWEDTTDTVTIYIDGESATTGSFAGPIGTNTANLRLGDYSDPSRNRPFYGTIDDVRIYSRALSGAEIAWLGGVTVPFDKPF